MNGKNPLDSFFKHLFPLTICNKTLTNRVKLMYMKTVMNRNSSFLLKYQYISKIEDYWLPSSHIEISLLDILQGGRESHLQLRKMAKHDT